MSVIVIVEGHKTTKAYCRKLHNDRLMYDRTISIDRNVYHRSVIFACTTW